MAPHKVISSALLGVAIILIANAANHCSEARSISYRAIRKGDPVWQCNSKHKNACYSPPVGSYQRGCETIEMCRQNPSPGIPGDNDEEISVPYPIPSPSPSPSPGPGNGDKDVSALNPIPGPTALPLGQDHVNH